MTTQNDEERLLSILHAHGQQFLSRFDIPVAQKQGANSDTPEEESEEEWTGFDSSPPHRLNSDSTASDGEYDGSEQENDLDDFAPSSSCIPDVTVFLDSRRKQPAVGPSAKQLRKSFMSSKVSNVTSSSMHPMSNEKVSDRESDDERTNTQNDAILHRLVHTKLLSGSLNPELDLNHAQRGRALAGRVLELAGEAKLGKGESVFRREQRNRAARRVRDGLVRKQGVQEQKALEEAKNLGNYHPTLKRIYDSNLSPAPKKKRTRGLGMGVGKFVGGTLKLSREEIASVIGSGKRSWGNGRRGGQKLKSK